MDMGYLPLMGVPILDWGIPILDGGGYHQLEGRYPPLAGKFPPLIGQKVGAPPVSWKVGTPTRVWTDRHLWKQYLPYPSDAGGNTINYSVFWKREKKLTLILPTKIFDFSACRQTAQKCYFICLSIPCQQSQNCTQPFPAIQAAKRIKSHI